MKLPSKTEPAIGKKAFRQKPEGFFYSGLTTLLVSAACLLFPALGSTPFRRAEIYFADAARAMIERGDWLVPYFRGEPFFDKPALTYWLLAASFRVFGFSEGVSRLTPAFTALLTILVTVWLGQLLWNDRRIALDGGWILAATAPFMAFGRTAMSDMLLVLWTTLAFALAVGCYRSLRPNACIVGLGAVLGLGFLTKGPIALLIPGIAILCLLWEKSAKRPPVSFPSVLLSASVFLVIALPWFVAVYLRLGIEPLRYFFIHENLQRFSGEAYNPGRSVWFYLLTYLGQGAPWSLLWIAGVLQFLRQREARAKTLLGWMFLTGILLTLSRGKVDYYLLPLYPPAALLVSRYIRSAAWGRSERWLLKVLLAGVGAILLVLPAFLLRLPFGWRPQGLLLIVSCVALVGAAAGCFVALFRPKPSFALAALVIAMMVPFGVANAFILPAFQVGQPNNAIVAAVTKVQASHPDVAFAAHEDFVQVHRDLLFHSRVILEYSNDLRAQAASSKPYFLLGSVADAAALKLVPGVREIASYRYLSSRIFTVGGLLNDPQPDELVLLTNFAF